LGNTAYVSLSIAPADLCFHFPILFHLQIYSTPIVQEVHKNITEWLQSVIRLPVRHNLSFSFLLSVAEFDVSPKVNAPYFEIEYTVGSIPIGDGHGKEVISRYSVTRFLICVFSLR
jgi:hypothetical protein